MRVLAIDLGKRRIGLALSDELGLTAQPLGVLARRGLRADVEEIAALCARHGVERVVVGLPLRLSGASGPEAEEAARFAERLRQRLDLPVDVWDERLSTREAERLLVEADVSRHRRRGRVDAVAAAIVLRAYLERVRAGRGGAGAADRG